MKKQPDDSSPELSESGSALIIMGEGMEEVPEAMGRDEVKCTGGMGFEPAQEGSSIL